MFTYIFVALVAGEEIEIQADSVSEKVAHSIAWNKLTDAQKDACESIDMVEVLA